MPIRAERIFAACAPGLEPVLAGELDALGLEARPVPGGAEASGEDAVAVACIGSRVADAVRLRIYEGGSRGLAAALRSARERFGNADFLVRRRDSNATVSLDAAGAPLHRRGYRERIGAAPLRETLAAGVLLACGYDGTRPLLDPMCGSGTFAIEAALIALRRAPALRRRFAFEDWPEHEPARSAAVRARLEASERARIAPIHASDRNGGAVRLTRKNAAAAGVAAHVCIERVDVRQVEPTGDPGLCIANPPYGRRLSDGAADAWRALASLFTRLDGWEAGILGPDRGLEKLLPVAPVSVMPVRNGGLACRLLRYRL